MRKIFGIASLIAAIALGGCPNPNDIGVQNYGTVAISVVDGTTGKPVSGALVSAGSTYTCTTVASGMCASPLRLPVGNWTITAVTAGQKGSSDVTVVENQQISTTIQIQ
ncbi:MAG TPA: hypothetical protein VID24_06120 [Candidatus Eremiobacteraceae bacterium]|jgi:hypothetical protein